MEEGNNNIFMVGDVKQSIYRFRLARPDLFMENSKLIPQPEGNALESTCTKISEAGRKCWTG